MKGEIACFEQFLLSSQWFVKYFTIDALKWVSMKKWVKDRNDCGKRRNCPYWAISTFSTDFYSNLQQTSKISLLFCKGTHFGIGKSQVLIPSRPFTPHLLLPTQEYKWLFNATATVISWWTAHLQCFPGFLPPVITLLLFMLLTTYSHDLRIIGEWRLRKKMMQLGIEPCENLQVMSSLR